MEHTQINLFDMLAPIDTTQEIIKAEDIEFIEYESFIKRSEKLSGGSSWNSETDEYDRDTGVYQIYAMYGRMTDKVLYVKDFMTYPHIEIYDTAKAADRAYKGYINHAREHCGIGPLESVCYEYFKLDKMIPIEDMYRIHDEKNKWAYSAKEHADKVNYGTSNFMRILKEAS